MVFDSIIDLYMQNFRRVCNILEIEAVIGYNNDKINIQSKGNSLLIPFKNEPMYVDIRLRKFLYDRIKEHEYSKNLLQNEEVLLNTMYTLPTVIEKVYTKLFIEQLKSALYAVKRKSQRSLQIDMQAGSTFFIYNMKDGKADVFFGKDLVESNIPFQSIISTIRHTLGEDEQSLDSLIEKFKKQLIFTEWVDDSYDKYNTTTILNVENLGNIYITRLSSTKYVLRTDHILPILTTADNFKTVTNAVTQNIYTTPKFDTVCKRFMQIMTQLLGNDYKYEKNIIYKNGKPYITRVGNTISTPQVNYNIDDNYRTMLHILRKIVTLQRRGYIDI